MTTNNTMGRPVGHRGFERVLEPDWTEPERQLVREGMTEPTVSRLEGTGFWVEFGWVSGQRQAAVHRQQSPYPMSPTSQP